MHFLKRSFVCTALLLSLFVLHPVAGAETSLAVEGTVTGVEGATVSLLGGLIRIDATTAVITSRNAGATLGIADILPGVEIRASIASVASSGILIASAIQVGRLEAVVEVTGALDSVDMGAGSFKLLGQTIATGSGTVFTGATTRGPVHSLADLQAGDVVDVTAAPSASGLIAIRVRAEKPQPAPGEHVEFVGTVESKSTTSWVVSGKTVLVTSETEITGSPAVGDTVKVEAARASDGTLTALEIQKIDQPPAPGERTEFTGSVESKSTTSWVISGKTVLITAHTEISGNPAVGDSVRVEALRASDGTLTALEIRKLDQPPPTGDRVDFSGTVTSKSTTSWMIGGRSVVVTPQTEIDGNPAVGDTVEVRGTRSASGVITALRIQKESSGGNDGGHHH